MDIKDLCNAGGDILDAVADAVNRNDYTGLSANVNNTVSRVITKVRQDAANGTYGQPKRQYGRFDETKTGQAGYRSIHESMDGRYTHLYGKNPETAATLRATVKKSRSPARAAHREELLLPAAIAKHPAGKISGPLQLAWGILATSGFGITALVMSILLAVQGGTVFLVLAAVFGVLTVFSITDIVRGKRKITLVNRFYRYARLIGRKGYIAIEELAFQTGRHREEVLRDLRKMMKKHMFLQGRLDNAETTFMLTQEAYQQYLQAEQSRRDMEQKAQRTVMPGGSEQAGYMGVPGQADGLAGSAQKKQDAQTKKILADGNAYIRMVHTCNEKIQNDIMSVKLSKLEAIMRRIFEQVEKDPASAEDLHKFMDYYLPTTTKLLQAYLDLDRQEIAGEHISATKKEIEDTLDTINSAFERLLDSLFEDMAWDVSSDISVMKTMMAQEGLTGARDFHL